MPDPVSFPADDTILLAGKARTLAEAELRAAEVRITAARVKVLAVLLSASYALAHQDIQAIVKIDRVTLYRVLASLIAAGLAHKISGDDRVSRYKATSDQEERNALRLPLQTVAPQRGRQHSHGHFQCTRCTRVFCLDHNREPGLLEDMFVGPDENGQKEMPEPLQSILLKTLGTGFQSHDIELIVKGWCADCAH
jgi:Fur family ferric uptake transcriptional regulator